MTPTYSIRDWSKHFENNRTRELKELRFVILPNKHDGDGYTELLDHPNGAAHYGAWVAIVQVASKCEIRGTLSRDGAKPHDACSLSRLTRIPVSVFEEALPRLVGIGWVESDVPTAASKHPETPTNQADSTKPQAVGAKPHPPAEKCPRTEENRTEEKEVRERHAKPRDERLDHPAMVAIREVKGRFPHKDVWDLVIKIVGLEPDVEWLRECWVAWRGKNYGPENLGWVTDWYLNGIPGANGNGRVRKAEPATLPVPVEQHNADWYIRSYTAGMKIAPKYNFEKDIAAIPDAVIREQVNQWWITREHGTP